MFEWLRSSSLRSSWIGHVPLKAQTSHRFLVNSSLVSSYSGSSAKLRNAVSAGMSRTVSLTCNQCLPSSGQFMNPTSCLTKKGPQVSLSLLRRLVSPLVSSASLFLFSFLFPFSPPWHCPRGLRCKSTAALLQGMWTSVDPSVVHRRRCCHLPGRCGRGSWLPVCVWSQGFMLL